MVHCSLLYRIFAIYLRDKQASKLKACNLTTYNLNVWCFPRKATNF